MPEVPDRKKICLRFYDYGENFGRFNWFSDINCGISVLEKIKIISMFKNDFHFIDEPAKSWRTSQCFQ